MALYLGSFTQGLFGGMQSTAQAYGMYQQIRATQNDLDAADFRKSMIAGDQANKDVPGYDPDKHAPSGVYVPAGYLKQGTPGQGPFPPSTQLEQAGPPTASGPDKGPVSPGKITAPAGGGAVPPSPFAADNQRVLLPSGYGWGTSGPTAPPPGVSPGAETAARGGTEGYQQPAAPPAPPPAPPRPALPLSTDRDVVAPPNPVSPQAEELRQGLPLPQPYSPAPRPNVVPGGGPVSPQAEDLRQGLPMASGYTAAPTPPVIPPSAQPVVAPTLVQPGGARAGAIEPPRIVPPGAVAQPAPEERPPPAPPAQPTPWQIRAGLRHGFLPTNTPTDGRGNYYDGTQWNPIPPGVHMQNAPTAAPTDAPGPALGAAQPSSGGGIGGAIWGALAHLNPISSAEAAPAPAGLPMAKKDEAGGGGAAAPAAPAAPAQGAAPAQPPAPVGGPSTYTQGIGATLTTPAAAPPSGGSGGGGTQINKPGPVAVPGKEGAVAPNQQGPSQQSETTPRITAPPVNQTYWQRLQQSDPEGAKRIAQYVETYGGGAVTVDQVAAHMYRESGFNWNIRRGNDGEYGPMQVMPGTFQMVTQGMGLNPNNPEHGMIAGILYLKHLANVEGFGANSTATNFAYMAGPGAAKEAIADFNKAMQNGTYRTKWNNLLNMYSGIKGGLGPNNLPTPGTVFHGPDTLTQVAKSLDTPDGPLSIIASTGYGGQGMTDQWRQMQAMMEVAAIGHGRYDMLGHIQDYVAQASHQGAITNLGAAWAALNSGNGQQAAGLLARAHAFFPDGTYARFGTDKNGNLFAQQFAEGSGVEIGKPFHVTSDMIAAQMIQLQNPRTFLETLQKYQKTNAEIAKERAMARYYGVKPELDAAALGLKQENLDLRGQIAGLHDQTQRDIAAARDESRTAAVNKVHDDVGKAYGGGDPGSYTKPDNVSEEQWARQADTDAALRTPQQHGGLGMTAPRAKITAEKIQSGALRLRPGIDKTTGRPGYAIYDPKEDPNAEHPLGHMDERTGGPVYRMLPAAAPIQPGRQAHAVGTAMAPTPSNFAGIQTSQPQMAA